MSADPFEQHDELQQRAIEAADSLVNRLDECIQAISELAAQVPKNP